MVEGYFAKGFPSLRNQVLSRYPSFFQKLLSSPSKEVRLLANIVSRDLHSVTAKNLKYISDITKLSPWDFSSARIKQELPEQNVPEKQTWRIGLLGTLVAMRKTKAVCVEDSKMITAMLHSLCNT